MSAAADATRLYLLKAQVAEAIRGAARLSGLIEDYLDSGREVPAALEHEFDARYRRAERLQLEYSIELDLHEMARP